MDSDAVAQNPSACYSVLTSQRVTSVQCDPTLLLSAKVNSMTGRQRVSAGAVPFSRWSVIASHPWLLTGNEEWKQLASIHVDILACYLKR